jgi:hypothetical protein
MNDNARKKIGRKLRRTDFFIILFCLCGAVLCVILFRLDLRKLDSRGKNPVGTVIIGNNIIQRRMADRLHWERIAVDSPLYSGDQIRTADLSNATLSLERNSIDLNGKTVIRIQRSPEDEDSFLIYLDEGNLVLSTAPGGGDIALNLMGRQVETEPGTILSASVGKDGTVVQVSEGTATLTGDRGEKREIVSGTMIAFDAGGAERTVKTAVVIQPRPDARYLKDGTEPLFVNFAWNRINLEPEEALCLELAEDRNFNRIIRVIENLDYAAGAAARVALNAGSWYWRLSLMPSAEAAAADAILATGRLNVVQAAGPALLSPAADSLIRYWNNLPQLRFQWSEITGASSYILEAAETPDFINPRLRTQTTSVFLFDSSLGSGTWYWRVMPVFPAIYEGRASFSPASFFRIEQGAAGDLAMVLPEPAPKFAPVLPAPLNRLPPAGHRIGIEQLRESNSIVFSWSAVPGANAYILTLYQDIAGGRRQIIRVPPGNRRSWTLENLVTLGRGTFIWQVEAVNINSAGVIEERGRIVENSFVIDIPRSGQVEIEDPGTNYGF